MAIASTPTAHIHLDERGVAWIDDTNVKVLEVALDKLAHGLSAEEIYREHDRHLSLAQIHAALSYYYDHQDEVDRQIQDQLQHVSALQSQLPESPFLARMRSLGRIP